ncbi:alanine aminotransferase 1 [Bacillus rossius redtenbacheri]|uniref:alanine aminotransferase 1 n=1 Tax=Bacillus rossius redtenbacheri TaxID=93214 RepID=UPI002FDE82E2
MFSARLLPYAAKVGGGRALSGRARPRLHKASTASRGVTRAMASAGGRSASKALSVDNMNPNVKLMEYAVRGPLVIRASEIEKELEKGMKKPFKEVIKANIGDCHAMGQTPITFIRQVVALVAYPKLLEDPSFPPDAKSHAQEILTGCRGKSVGSYTDSPGIEVIRRHCAEYIHKRDGIPSNWEDILLCAGASEGIKNVLKLLNAPVDGKKPGVMVPIPQYPLYSATIAEYGMQQIGYYLDESKNWSLDVSELKRAVSEAKKVCEPRVLVVINPGNPTGQVLSRKNIEEVIKFAHEEELFIFADEVYQDNVYEKQSKFHSFKKVSVEMGTPYKNIQMASFLSSSKGYMGECGLRGGYAEVVNLQPEVKAMLLKCISASLCPTVLGQAVMDVVVHPPQPDEPSYGQFVQEKEGVLRSLAERATMVAEAFNSIEGISCNSVQGAMYAFPQLRLPEKAVKEAQSRGMQPDTFYAFQLLENTGICVVPGSGFGQREGTYHFRTTILPQPEKLKTMLDQFRSFHLKFMQQYK